MKKSKTTGDLFGKFDAFVNANNHLNTSDSPTGGTAWGYEIKESAFVKSNMYRFNKVVNRGITIIPDEALAKGLNFTSENVQYVEKFKILFDKLKTSRMFRYASYWARLYGGSCILVGAMDGTIAKSGVLDQQLNLNTISDIKFLKVIDKEQLQIRSYDNDIMSDTYGEPITYSYTPVKGGSQKTIHASRLIRFDGVILPDCELEQNDNWHGSLLDLVLKEIKHYNIATDSGADLLQQYITNVLKLEGLAELLEACDDENSGNRKAIEARMNDLIKKAGNLRQIVIGGQDDYNKQVIGGISGYTDLQNLIIEIASAAFDVPRSIFFSQQLGTLAGAEETSDVYYRSLEQFQENKLKDQFNNLFEIFHAFLGGKPEDFVWSFNSVRAKSDKQMLEEQKIAAETDAINIGAGVYSPEKAAERYANGSFNNHINLEQEDIDGAKGIDDITEEELGGDAENDSE